QKEPTRRYPTALDLTEDLARFRAGVPIRARPTGTVERLWRACRRNPVVAGLTAALAAFLVAAAVLGTAGALRYAWLAGEAHRAQTAAEESAEESRRRLAQHYVSNGEQRAATGDRGDALAWLAEAFDLDREPSREWVHRVALTSLLRQMPRLL